MSKKLKRLFKPPFYFRDLKELKRQKGTDETFFFGRPYPIDERKHSSGTMSGAYFHQDLFVARKIFENNPTTHVDIGSRTDGFVAHVAAFREIEVIDIRDQPSKVKNISFKQADLMELDPSLKEYTDSISSLHSIEHFGLGRYGDPIDYFGYKKAIKNMTIMLKPGGRFYFSVPIGPQRIEFNAHRVFSVEYLVDLLNEDFEIEGFSWVDDKGDFHEREALEPSAMKNSYGCNYGCGIFELIKK